MNDRQEVGRKKLEQDARKLRALFPQHVWSTTGYTGATFNYTSFSTTAKTLLDLSTEFGIPAGIRAVTMMVDCRDSGSAGTNPCHIIWGPNNTAGRGAYCSVGGVPDDYWRNYWLADVPCNANGDIYYQIVASGANTFDVFVRVWGYAI